MVAPVTVSEKDLRTLLGIVSDGRADLPAEGGLPLSLLADLMGQIRCDTMSFEGLDSNLQTEWFWQGIPDWDDDDARAEAASTAGCGCPAAPPQTGESGPCGSSELATMTGR